MSMIIFQVLLALGYPLIVFFGLKTFEPREIGLGLLLLVILRLLARPSRLLAYARTVWLPAGGVVAIAMTAALSNHPVVLLLAPTLINWTLLLTFTRSLFWDAPMVERFARIQAGSLSLDEIHYCRVVTAIWCVFFLVNGSIALALALASSVEAWTWYTGLIGYVLMGILFTAELTVRHWRFRRYLGSPTDVIFRWIFPPIAEHDAHVPLSPQVTGRTSSDELRQFDLQIPEALACWPGHFPGYSVVPGVLQLDWVMAFIEEWAGTPAAIERIEGLKFMNPLLPGQTAKLSLQRSNGCTFRFKIENDAGVFSLGRILLSKSGTLL
jgi:uncharacterized membrane protein